jgi:TPR repeat protein
MYQNGDLVETDTVEAMLWYTEAAYQGHLRAQYSLAEMYYYGRGVVQNDTEALRWFKKAAEQGFAEAQYALGLLLKIMKVSITTNLCPCNGMPRLRLKIMLWLKIA